MTWSNASLFYTSSPQLSSPGGGAYQVVAREISMTYVRLLYGTSDPTRMITLEVAIQWQREPQICLPLQVARAGLFELRQNWHVTAITRGFSGESKLLAEKSP